MAQKLLLRYILFLGLYLSTYLLHAQCNNTANFVQDGTATLVTGTPSWINPNNILNNDAVSATYTFPCTAPPCTTGTNPSSIAIGGSFPSLPSNAVICGLTVLAYGSASGTGGSGINYSLEVRLFNDGTQIGRKFIFDNFCSPLFGCGSYGGTNDLWGNTSLSVADLTSGNFKIAFYPNVNMPSTVGTGNISVNYTTVRVNYSLPVVTPVNFINFRIEQINSNLNFYWTAVEEDMDYYLIEMFHGNKWETIGYMKANGTGNYEYQQSINLDVQFRALVRLHAVDKMRSSTYSSLLEIDNKEDLAWLIKGDNLEISLRTMDNSKILIYTLNGKLIDTQFLDSEHNKIDISKFTSGLYLAKVQSNSKINMFRFIKD